jgi:hypothetical protein
MANGIKKIKRLKLLRRIGLVGAIISSFTIIIFLILSFLPKGSSAFTIKIDNPSNSNAVNLAMTTSETSEKEINVISATPILRALTTKAQDVEAYLSSQEKLEGSQNINETISGADYQRALVYTVYLKNKSEDTSKDLRVYYQVNLDGYSTPTNNANLPIDYFRILVQKQFTDSNEIENIYYGNRRTSDNMNLDAGGYITDIGQYVEGYDSLSSEEKAQLQSREPISSRWFDINPEDGKNMLKRDWYSSGNNGYCINFDAYETGHLVSDVYIDIPAGKTLRFTFVAYFDGVDVDCDGKKPENSNILLSLHFGVQ